MVPGPGQTSTPAANAAHKATVRQRRRRSVRHSDEAKHTPAVLLVQHGQNDPQLLAEIAVRRVRQPSRDFGANAVEELRLLQANTDMFEAIQKHGIDVERYNTIARSISQDPELAKRVQAKRKELQQ
jgi:hypothetical protein